MVRIDHVFEESYMNTEGARLLIQQQQTNEILREFNYGQMLDEPMDVRGYDHDTDEEYDFYEQMNSVNMAISLGSHAIPNYAKPVDEGGVKHVVVSCGATNFEITSYSK